MRRDHTRGEVIPTGKLGRIGIELSKHGYEKGRPLPGQADVMHPRTVYWERHSPSTAIAFAAGIPARRIREVFQPRMVELYRGYLSWQREG